jgi:type IV secretory pathway VirB2 component (pilin)
MKGTLMTISLLAPWNVSRLRKSLRRSTPTIVRYSVMIGGILLLCSVAHATPVTSSGDTGSPFGQAMDNVLQFMTGPVAKVGALVGMVLAGVLYATGDPTAKKAAVAAGVGSLLALSASAVITWLGGGF